MCNGSAFTYPRQYVTYLIKQLRELYDLFLNRCYDNHRIVCEYYPHRLITVENRSVSVIILFSSAFCLYFSATRRYQGPLLKRILETCSLMAIVCRLTTHVRI